MKHRTNEKIKKLIIANRGESAMRILHAARDLGLKTVAIYSDIDANLLHVKHSDQAFCIGEGERKHSYLNADAILKVASLSNADAIHPGYGFMAENAEFIKRAEDQGIIFIGPSADVTAQIENKITARKLMRTHGIECVPGTFEPLGYNDQDNLALAAAIGYPLIVQAVKGGGGRAMKIVHREGSLLHTILMVRADAESEFHDSNVFLAKFIDKPKHLELQIIADTHGNVVQLGMRDCSVQHWNKKIIEESPAPGIDPAAYQELAAKCIKVCQAINYCGVGTIEFLYADHKFYFVEMNTRIQLGHSVSEAISGVDLVKEQILVAMGNPLSFKQDDIALSGHAIECRIYAEKTHTPALHYGLITDFHAPGGPGIRVDSHIYAGYEMPHLYDPLIAKITAFSDTRVEALNILECALEELIIKGVNTNLPLIQEILADPAFVKGKFRSDYLDKKLGYGQ